MRFESQLTTAVGAYLLATILVASACAPSRATANPFQEVLPTNHVKFASWKEPAGLGRLPQPRLRKVAPVSSRNFVVYSNDEVLSRKVSAEAERFRRKLAIQWLGEEIPEWTDKCPITVEVNPNAGGETSFQFVPGRRGKGVPIKWQMKIYGPPNRLLDAVLPHEITHTIFATHFGRPLPRWADEGACTTVEHESEKRKNHKMLIEFLRSKPSRGIPFNRMFTMRNYPHDILPLYAQGYSLARFLINQKGHRHFVDFVSAGLRNESRYQELRAWDLATEKFYGYKDLSDLQIQWLGWVKGGSQEIQNKLNGGELAVKEDGLKKGSILSVDSQSRNVKEIRPIGFVGGTELESLVKTEPTPTVFPQNFSQQSATSSPIQQTFTNSKSGSWYGREMQKSSQADNAQAVLSSNKTRKVSSEDKIEPTPPTARDSRLPQEYRDSITTWR